VDPGAVLEAGPQGPGPLLKSDWPLIGPPSINRRREEQPENFFPQRSQMQFHPQTIGGTAVVMWQCNLGEEAVLETNAQNRNF